MRIRILTILIALVAISCISENEQKGLNEVAALYNTNASYSKGFKTNNGETLNIFTIKIENGALLDSLPEALTSSNIALMLYKSFTPKEKEAYSYIEVRKNNDSTESEGSMYDPVLLADAADQLAIYDAFSKKIIDKDYDGVVKALKPEYQSPTVKQNLENFMSKLLSAHGAITEFKRIEFGIYTTQDGEKLFQFGGYFTFKDGYNQHYSVTSSMDPSIDYITGYNIE